MSKVYTCPKCGVSKSEVVHLAWGSINEIFNWEGEGRDLDVSNIDDESFQCTQCGEEVKDEWGDPITDQSDMMSLFVEEDSDDQ